MKQRRTLRSTLSIVTGFLFVSVVGAMPAWSQVPAPPTNSGPPPPPPTSSQLPKPPPGQQPVPAQQPAPTAPTQAPPAGPPPEQEPPPPPMQMPTMQQPTPQALATPGPEAKTPAHVDVAGIAAMVNGHPITNSALVSEYLADGGQPTLDELVDRELVEQAAAKAHVTVSDAEVEARIKEAKQQVMAQIWMRSPGMTWAQFLTTQGRSEYYVRQNIKTRILLEKLVAKTLPSVSLAGKMHLYHILLLTTPMPGHATPHSDADALAQITKIRADIEGGKITFQAAAKKYSEDTFSAIKSGDLGWVGPTDPLDPDFMKAAKGLKEGEISQPVKSRYGYHLIYLARLGEHATPAEIKAETDAQNEARVGQQLQPYLAKLHSDAKIQNLLMPGVPLPQQAAARPGFAPVRTPAQTTPKKP